MEAKNLRIGNYIRPIQGNFERSRMYTKDKESFYSNNNCVMVTAKGLVDLEDNLIKIEPIPLTEDWLTKLGFDDSGYKPGYIGIDSRSSNGMITDFVITKPKHIGEWQNYYAFDLPSHRFCKFEYVHELQNLFNAITGHELEFSQQ